jgi:hypothetical protein
VGLGRVGRELFPALIIALAVVLAAEQLLANRFYGGRLSAIGSQPSARTEAAQFFSPIADSQQPTAGAQQRPDRNPQSRPVVLEPIDV